MLYDVNKIVEIVTEFVRKDERKRCAKIARRMMVDGPGDRADTAFNRACEKIAEAIEFEGEK